MPSARRHQPAAKVEPHAIATKASESPSRPRIAQLSRHSHIQRNSQSDASNAAVATVPAIAVAVPIAVSRAEGASRVRQRTQRYAANMPLAKRSRYAGTCVRKAWWCEPIQSVEMR